MFINLLLSSSHQEPRWPEDHFDRDKRQAEWDFSKDFFCDVPGKILTRDMLKVPYYAKFTLPMFSSNNMCLWLQSIQNYIAISKESGLF